MNDGTVRTGGGRLDNLDVDRDLLVEEGLLEQIEDDTTVVAGKPFKTVALVGACVLGFAIWKGSQE